MPQFSTQGDTVTIAGIDLKAHYKVNFSTIDRSGIVTQRFLHNPPLPWFRAKLNTEAYPDQLGYYVLPRRVDLEGVTITAVPGQWSIHVFSRETGELIDVERHPADGPGVSALRRAASLARIPIDGSDHVAVVLVEPLNVTPAPQTEE